MADIDEIISKIKNNSYKDNVNLADELKSKLTDSQSDALAKLLSDKQKLTELMNSPEAKNILKKLGGDANGHK